MEKRAEPRFDTERAVRLTTLGEPAEELVGSILNVSGSGMRLRINRDLAPGSAVKVEWDDTLLLGDVCYCQPMPGGFAIGLALEQVLLHTSELARLAKGLIAAGADIPILGQAREAPVRRLPDR